MYLYMITNKINGKRYIGVTNNIQKRWSNHRSKINNKTVIGRAIQKYGAENFNFEVLQSNIPLDKIDKAEQDAIQYYDTHVSNSKGYNVSLGGYLSPKGICKYGADNSNAHLTEEEAKYIKSHRNIPLYVLYDSFSDKISYEAFKKVYDDTTYKNIKPTVDPYPYNFEFSNQFTSGNKLDYDEVVNLRKKYAAQIPWRKVYEEEYKDRYSDEMTFWNIYVGNRYKLVMPEVFTEENKHFQAAYSHSGEDNGRAKLTKKDVQQMRFDFENNLKTRKEIQDEYKDIVSPSSINNILGYRTWKNI